MPAGDSCYFVNDQHNCAAGLTCAKNGDDGYVCQGLSQGQACIGMQDVKCNPGLACQFNQVGLQWQCLPTIKRGDQCNSTVRCQFGTECWNGTCTRYGSLPVGSEIYVTTN